MSWKTYRTLKEAKVAATAARNNAAIQTGLGYDFGYQVPGTIEKVEKGYEVVLP